LIEVVVSISLGVIISGIAAFLIGSASKLRAEVSARGEMTDRAAAAMDVMCRYIREIPQDECASNPTPCLLGNAQISVAAANEIRFGSRGFRYNAGAGAMEMTSDSGTTWQPLAKDVTQLSLSYFSRTGTSLGSFPLSAADREDVRRVVIDLRMTRGTEGSHLRSGVYLRSFMNEVASDP
jgi:hypothetical protein